MNSKSPPKPGPIRLRPGQALDGAASGFRFGRATPGLQTDFANAHAVHYSTFEQWLDNPFQPLASFTAVVLQIIVRARCWPSITAS